MQVNGARKYTPEEATVSHIIQLTDTHFMAEAAAEFVGVNTRQSLARVLAFITENEPRVDALLVSGDLSHDGSAESYMALRDALQPLEIPAYCIPGNHDDSDTLRQYLSAGWIVCTESTHVGNWHVVFLDTCRPGSQGGQLGPQRLAQFNAMLESSSAPTLVVLHHPPVPIGSPWMDAMGLADAADFLAVVERHAHIRAVVFGHIHQEFELRRGGTWFWGTPSTCVQFMPGATQYMPDDHAPGYRRLLLCSDGRISSEVVRVAT